MTNDASTTPRIPALARRARPLVATLWLSAAGLGACSDAEVKAPAPSQLVPDVDPLSRMSAEQYLNTLRDLFPPLDFGDLQFPVELEGRGGFENNATLNTATPALVEAYQRTARLVATRVGENANAVLGCDPQVVGCARDWLAPFVERAWRRPLSADEREALEANFDMWSAQYDLPTALNLSIGFTLQSADFIYFPRFGAGAPAPGDEAVPLDAWELASRLSYFLWNSMPDEELFELARGGTLVQRQVLADQAFRMLGDWRAVDMVVSFHRQNWDFDEAGANAIDLEFYGPVFNEKGFFEEDDKSDYYYLEYSPQARYEADVFVAQHIFRGDGRLESLLTSNRTWTTAAVADWAYQTNVDTNLEPVSWEAKIPSEGNDELSLFSADYYPVDLDPDKRAGLFTMVGFLIAKAGPRQPAPVRRGVTILDRLLCTELTPPGDVPPLEESETMAPKTNREKYLIHVQNPSCAACHSAIDGIGLTFENYDAMGRWRDTDNGYPVDATGQLLGTDQDGEVNNAVGMMRKLGRSRKVHDCYTQQWFRYAFGRVETEADAPTLAALQEGFWDSKGDVLELVVNLAGSYSFRHKKAQP